MSKTISKDTQKFICKIIPWDHDQNSKNIMCPIGVKIKTCYQNAAFDVYAN